MAEINDSTYRFSWLDLFKLQFHFLGTNKVRYLFWTLSLFILYFFDLVPPYIVGRIVDFFSKYTAGQSINEFYGYVIFLGVSICLTSMVRLTIKRKIFRIRNGLMYEIKTQGFQNLLNYSLKWHDQENTGNKIQRIMNGSAAMKNLIQLQSNEIYRFIVALLGAVGILMFLDIKFFFIVAVYLVCFFAVEAAFYRKMQSLINQGNTAQEKASGKYYEGITNILSIKSLGAGNSLKSKIKTAESDTRILADRLTFLGTTKWQVFQVINALVIVSFLLVLGNVYLNGIISIGSILVYWSYFNTMINNTGEMTKYLDDLIENKQSIARMLPIFKDLDGQVNTGNKKFPSNWNTIQIKNGYFQYDAGKDFILNDINLTIAKNQKIGIAGQTGSGKSSLAKLMLGLYKLNKGDFLIGDLDYYSIDNAEVTKNISIVLQESELFNFSLRENITLLKNVSDELVSKAIEISQLQNVISKLPEGLETMIGEKGYRVSGGERQRIAIARAVCMDTPILLLDEATSNLDVNTEKAIQTAIETRLHDKTIITIAHRSSTLEKSDQIYVFKKGQIVEQGTYQELRANPQSEFSQLNA
jgi:ABC-type multidrug transport system fused ATPase/permease subunit